MVFITRNQLSTWEKYSMVTTRNEWSKLSFSLLLCLACLHSVRTIKNHTNYNWVHTAFYDYNSIKKNLTWINKTTWNSPQHKRIFGGWLVVGRWLVVGGQYVVSRWSVGGWYSRWLADHLLTTYMYQPLLANFIDRILVVLLLFSWNCKEGQVFSM